MTPEPTSELQAVGLREIEAADLAGIVDLDALRSGERKPAYWRRILGGYEGDSERDAALGGHVGLVAVDADGALCGFLLGEVRAWEFGSERCGWIFSVTVHPECERHGLATRLCEAAMRRFAALGVGLVRTMVRRDEVPMLALFRSMGFRAGPFSELERRVSPTIVEKEGAA